MLFSYSAGYGDKTTEKMALKAVLSVSYTHLSGVGSLFGSGKLKDLEQANENLRHEIAKRDKGIDCLLYTSKSAVFGIIYNLIKEEYRGNVINLPILQIPEQIREVDPNLFWDL